MQLIIISGRSGSGKSTALNVLEDVGYTCIDNLPASLLPSLAARLKQYDQRRYAVSIDARNAPEELQQLPAILEDPTVQALEHHIIYLDANVDILLTRFSETRRKHPLTDELTNLHQAIEKESERLRPILEMADVSIDTSGMKYHDLRDFIKRRYGDNNTGEAAILFQSFGFKYGLPKDADLVFDVRCLPNPHWRADLRPLTGKDEAIKIFLEEQSEVEEMYQDIKQFLQKWLPQFQESNRSYITIAIGCTGGRHRSVYLCERLSESFDTKASNIQLRHRELEQHA